MTLKERIEAFSILGAVLRDALDGKETVYADGLHELINNQHIKNPWFTPENVKMSVRAIAEELTRYNLEIWTKLYPTLEENRSPAIIAVVMAGNIPLVGFHDFLSVLITGNKIIAKVSSKDSDLIKFIGRILITIESRFSKMIMFTDGLLSGFDAVIATGSDNTSRYFEYYFSRYPHLIRKNRNSAALIEGNETEEELEKLGLDIFSYFGLGCRNVSKIYLPEDCNPATIAASWESYRHVTDHYKYANNYDYNKAVYLVNKESFADTGFLLLKESSGLSSPVAVLFYEKYDSHDAVRNKFRELDESIQCIVGKNHVPFGQSQFPRLWDYADRMDTIDFLLKKKYRKQS